MSAGKDAEGVPGATTKKVVLVCPYASCLGFSGRPQRKPTLGDAGSVQASRGDVRSARSGEGGQGRMHGEAVTCHLSKEVFFRRAYPVPESQVHASDRFEAGWLVRSGEGAVV